MDMRQTVTSESVQPDKPCDIVMEGGAASGVVYPRALYELSRRYRFQRIGGTSAGAVAAAFAAAAEYGRRNAEQQSGGGNDAGFDELAAVPAWFAQRVDGGTRLQWLFAPEREMRPAYELFMAFISTQGVVRVAGSLLWAGARFFPWSFFGGALLGVLIGALAVHGALQIAGPLGVLLAIAAAFLGLVVAAVFAVLLVVLSLGIDVVLKMPRHHFGVARAYSRTPEKDPSPRVTNWMHGLIQKVAGKPSDQPLTFGDLERCADIVVGNDQGIALRLMTTCLTHGRPYRMPFDDGEEVFYHDADELALFFPPEVVDWMKRHPNPKARPYDGYHALPRAKDFPVVVAARMSMSFPFFFSSIPLYAPDRTRHPELSNRDEALSDPRLERCWFADGGICSNLPVHFFDRALPRWPTFALDLREFHRDLKARKDTGAGAVWIDHDFRDAAGRSIMTEWWSVLPHEGGRVDGKLGIGASLARAKAFLGAVLDTMMNWRDNVQLRPIGSRDRVAHVSLDAEEGSFNLSMGPDQVAILAERGMQAGRKLREHFASGSGWRENRGARLVSFLTVTGEYLHCVKKACDHPVAGDRSYVEELEDSTFHPVDCVLSDPQKSVARGLLERTLSAAETVPDDGDDASLAMVVPPPRQTIRFLPEGEPMVPRERGETESYSASLPEVAGSGEAHAARGP